MYLNFSVFSRKEEMTVSYVVCLLENNVSLNVPQLQEEEEAD